MAVRVSALPITGMTLTRGESRLISSISISRSLQPSQLASTLSHCLHSRVTGRRDEVEQRVNSVIPEPRVSLDSRFFSENVVVLSFQIARDFLEAGVVSDGGNAGMDR